MDARLFCCVRRSGFARGASGHFRRRRHSRRLRACHPAEWQEVLQAFGHEVSRSQLQELSGRDTDELLAELLPQVPEATRTRIFQEGFRELPKASQCLHLLASGLLAILIGFLIVPTMHHRLVERGQATAGCNV